MPFARAGSVRIFYRLTGRADAPPLVMQRGLARSHRYWLGIENLFAEHFRVVLMDNRGVGQSDVPPPPYSTAQMASDVVAVMDHAGIEKAHFFGLSLGGMIGQWLAIRHAHRVKRLVLGATMAGGPGSKRIPLGAVYALLRCARLPMSEAMQATAPYTLHPSSIRRRPDIVRRWCEIAESERALHQPWGVVAQAVAGAIHNASRSVSRIRQPTLVITGDEDRLIPPENSYWLARRIPDAQMHVLPAAGHDFPTEYPEETFALIRRFLCGLGVKRP